MQFSAELWLGIPFEFDDLFLEKKKTFTKCKKYSDLEKCPFSGENFCPECGLRKGDREKKYYIIYEKHSFLKDLGLIDKNFDPEEEDLVFHATEERSEMPYLFIASPREGSREETLFIYGKRLAELYEYSSESNLQIDPNQIQIQALNLERHFKEKTGVLKRATLIFNGNYW